MAIKFRFNVRLIEGLPLRIVVGARGSPSRPEIPGPPDRPGPIRPPTALPEPIPTFPDPNKPLPQPGRRVPTSRPPFGIGGPAANDPVFRRGAAVILRQIIGPISKVLGPIGSALGVKGLLDTISEQLLENAFEQWVLREISSAKRGRIARESTPREVSFPSTVPQTPPASIPRPDPGQILTPGRIEIFENLPLDLPGFPGQLPSFPGSPGGPGQPRQPRRQPKPRSPRRTDPRPQSPGQPGTRSLPGSNPLFRVFPLGSPFPGASVRRSPLQDPNIQLRPGTPRLTPGQPSGLPSPGPGVVGIIVPGPGVGAQPRTRTQRKCEEVKRRRRKKGKCREGYFEELPGKTRYTTWRTVDCVTRKKPRAKLRVVKRTI